MSAISDSATQFWCLFDTELGICAMAWTSAGIQRTSLPDHPEKLSETFARRTGSPTPSEPEGIAAEAIARLRTYFGGTPTEFDDLPLDQSGISEINLSIYARARALHWGEMATYGDIASEIGEPGAARIVGQAMGANRTPVIIPCHRVVAASGKLGGFSAPGGNRTKAKMLNMEQARPRSAETGQISLL